MIAQSKEASQGKLFKRSSQSNKWAALQQDSPSYLHSFAVAYVRHSFAVAYVRLLLESLLFPCFQAFFIFKIYHVLLAFYIVLCYNKYYTKRSACYVPQKNTEPEWSDSPFHC